VWSGSLPRYELANAYSSAHVGENSVIIITAVISISSISFYEQTSLIGHTLGLYYDRH
jgi:hypothetical protein